MKKKFIVCLTAGVLAMSLLFGGCGKVDPVAQKVMDEINAIGEVTIEDEQLIVEIKGMYDTLTDKQKSQVDNYINLIEAEETIEQLKAEELEAFKEQFNEEPNKGALWACTTLKSNLIKPESFAIYSISVAEIDGTCMYSIKYGAENKGGGTTTTTAFVKYNSSKGTGTIINESDSGYTDASVMWTLGGARNAVGVDAELILNILVR